MITMDKQTLEALKTVLKISRLYAGEKSHKKRKTQQEVYQNAILYRDLTAVEKWVESSEFEQKILEDLPY